MQFWQLAFAVVVVNIFLKFYQKEPSRRGLSSEEKKFEKKIVAMQNWLFKFHYFSNLILLKM